MKNKLIDAIYEGKREEAQQHMREMVRSSIESTYHDEIVTESFNSVAKKYAGEFGGKVPKSAALQSPTNKNEHILILGANKKFIAVWLNGNRVVKDQRLTSSALGTMIQSSVVEGWKFIDTRSFLRRNLGWIAGVVGMLTLWGATAATFLALGGDPTAITDEPSGRNIGHMFGKGDKDIYLDIDSERVKKNMESMFGRGGKGGAELMDNAYVPSGDSPEDSLKSIKRFLRF